MKTIFYRQDSRITEDEIQSIELLYSKSLPIEYKEFLLEHNGGGCYPNYPVIKIAQEREIWNIDMFYSLGDLVVNKHNAENDKYPIHFHQPDDLAKYGLMNENLLPFAIAERGWYFMNLSEDQFGQLYFCNYSGGEGIVDLEMNSFHEFTDSLGFPEWDDSEYDHDRINQVSSHIPGKVTMPKYFKTPSKPEIGLNHFKNCYRYFVSKNPPENRMKYLASSYVNYREIVNFLIDEGHNASQLLFGRGINFESIQFIVSELGIDINEPYEDRFAIHSILTPESQANIKVKYQLIHDLIQSGIKIEWSVIGKQFHDGENITALERLKLLNSSYRKYEEDEMKRYGEKGLPHGSAPFFRSSSIEGILINETKVSWKTKLTNRITRGNKR